MIRVTITGALGVWLLAFCAPVHAQEYPTGSTQAPVGRPAQAPLAGIPSSPAAPPGALDPVVRSDLDLSMILVGAAFFAAGYGIAAAGAAVCARCEGVGFVPFIHWLSPFVENTMTAGRSPFDGPGAGLAAR